MGRRKLCGKHAKDLAGAIKRAGGSLSVTANGHFRVTGPKGVAIVGVHTNSRRALAHARMSLRNYAGLEI